MKLELAELAECLHLPLYTVERWIRQGRMPARKTGSQCVFKRVVLEKWAEKHDITFTLNEDHATPKGHDDKDGLLAALKRGGLHYNVTGDSVDEALQQAVSCIPDFSDDERSLLLTKLLEREKLTSTGIGKGVAIPHPRSPLPGKERPALICTCFLKNKIDFKAIDDKTVSVMFVIVCPTVTTHLHLLSRISYCLRNDSFVTSLNKPLSPDEFFQKIEEFEEQLEKAR
ncbi:MAG: PTS sugar transporter subunit IIA [Proteobacteria bacterium]|nr:PTS sugar transporter subunit IIA [Pseudomonadota bacterium]